MIQVSDDFKTAMKQPIKELDAYIEIDDDTRITSADALISFKISCDTGLCKSAMRKLEAKYLGEENLLGKWVKVGFGVKLPNGTFEYINYGSFLITEITFTKDTGTTNIVGYDTMINAMKEYIAHEIEYPINLPDYTKLLCNYCNLELGNELFNKNIYDTTYRRNGEIVAVNCTATEENGTYTIEATSNNAYLWLNGLRGTPYLENRGKLYELDDQPYTIKIYNSLFTKNYVSFYNEDKDCISINAFDSTQITFQAGDGFVPENAKYFTLRFGYGNSTAGEIYTVKVQIEKNETATSYIPYNSMNNWQITKELWENIDDITYRDILVQIAQATGTTCFIGNDDKVYFNPINETGEELTYDNMKKLKLEPIYGEINSVVLSRTPQEDNIYMRDEASINTNGLTEWKIENNEIIDKDRDKAMTPIYNAMHGIKFYPFETTTEGLGWYEIADNIDIINDYGDVFNTSIFNYSILIDGGIKETLKTVAETKTQTQYQYATTIAKRLKNTEIIVDKQEQYIESLVTDMYEEDGIVHENFTNVHQDIENIISSVQNSGGINLIKNSVMFAYDTENKPNDWELSETGSLLINSSAEALSSGGISGHIFTLLGETVKQKVIVKADSDDIPEDEKTYYSFSTKIKKDVAGTCYVKIYNTNEEYIINIGAGESCYYKEYEISKLLPKENYYYIEFYGSSDSNATFTDNMFNIGQYKMQWQQASGEIMNTQVNINVDGVLVKSSVYNGDYTVMSPLEFAGYSNINGTVTKIFTLNKDTTEVMKLKSTSEISMPPIKIVPITTGNMQGWAFVPMGGA